MWNRLKATPHTGPPEPRCPILDQQRVVAAFSIKLTRAGERHREMVKTTRPSTPVMGKTELVK